jgi:hypothetical protein
MLNNDPQTGLSQIIELLARHSARPRYGFLVLQLIADVIDAQGRAGPFIRQGNVTYTIRDWLVTGLMPLSSRDGRREAMRERIRASLGDRLVGEPEADEALLEEELGEQARNVGRQNVSRAISDLVKAALVTRHYAGYATDHANRGAGRHAVYVLAPTALKALGKVVAEMPAGRPPMQSSLSRQPDLFGISAAS